MTFKDCLNTAVEGGELSKEDARRLERDFDRFRQKFAGNSETMADAEAKRALSDLLKAESAHQKRKAKLSLSSIKRIAADIGSYKNPRGEHDIAAAAEDLLEHFGTAPFDSVEGRRKAIVGMAHARMENVLAHFKRGAIGGDRMRHNKAQLDNVAREAFGEHTGDEASKFFAKTWEDTHEWLRQRFNAAGGAIGKLERWGLPQRHDARALRKVGLEEWRNQIRPRLDVARMKHPLTGEPVDESELDEILAGIWTGVTTDGWATRDPLRQAFGRGALANQRAEHRFLVFRDADNWLAYQRDFGGGGDVFAAMMGHINMMAKDIAALEVLGPNPSGTIEWLKQAIKKEAMLKAAGKPSRLAGKPERAIDAAAAAEKKIDAMWGSIRGSLETPVNGRWAAGLSATRGLITASVLGSAAISSLSDIGTTMVARHMVGIGARGAFADLVKAIGGQTRREAVASGLILDEAMHVFHAQARYVGTIDGPGWSSFIADRVLTYSGLTPWTQAGRHAFGLAFMRTAAENAGKRFKDLPPALRDTFGRYGIRELDWDKMRNMPLHDMGRGTTILRPNEIAERIDERLAERYLGMVQSETEFAIPSGSHRSKVFLMDENRPGTFLGEVLRSFAQFKSFGVVFLMLHGRRVHGMIAGGDPLKGAAYAGSLLISTTLFGAMAAQLKQMAQGRDPQNMDPMNNSAFWGAALLQGGGLGIYGDFLFSNLNRYGGGFATTFGGPLMQRANDAWNLTAGNLVQLASGEKTHFGRELVKFAKGNTPGSSIWYLRLGWERLLMDQLQFLVDPEANKAFKQRQRFFAKEYGQGFWWDPGQTAPSRAPDLGAALGG
jgi:polyhydroxyalkanoate synthesis regulator phasin